jgi:hypothetical protein
MANKKKKVEQRRINRESKQNETNSKQSNEKQ